MSWFKDADSLMRRMVEGGVTDREVIDAAAYDAFAGEVDAEYAIRREISGKVSAAIAKWRDDDNKRLAFPDKAPDGKRRVVHKDLCTDIPALIRVQNRYDAIAREAAMVRDEVHARIVQLDIFRDSLDRAA